jgi:hypothetical protein
MLGGDVSGTSAPEPPGWDIGAAPACFKLLLSYSLASRMQASRLAFLAALRL